MCLWNTNATDNGQFQWRARTQGQISFYLDLVTRNAQVQYESSNIYYFVINNMSIFFKVSKLTYPTLQHCLKVLHITNGNVMHEWREIIQKIIIKYQLYLSNKCHICVTFGNSLSKRYLIELLLCHSCYTGFTQVAQNGIFWPKF